MKRHIRFLGNLFNKKNHQNTNVGVDLIEYSDKGIYYVYSPALDLIGYGKTEKESRDSWEVVLQEYLSYTINKNTLIRDLESRGWKVKRNGLEFMPPTFSWMLENIEELGTVYNTHDFRKRSQSVALPAQVFA